ncbi:hypothetical protein C1645_827111 [Glomus cerebriforme]|uniref:Uncharacterized protein n=1 Tax=Glomus cerebriforme TaxID=658196 RepID=A0A397SP35_9GLOM|nr:hypothetical protein C1645_827111 [Glomus cerebriforme]
MSVRQPQVPSAFEIRFSTSDSILEVFEIQPDSNSQERNVPDPFKKRDKIPRSSGSLEQVNNINNNNNNNNNSGNINGTIAPLRHSITDSQNSPMKKSRHHGESPLKKGMSTNSDQVSSSLKKSSNAVGPEADKQQLRGGKNSNVENSIGNDVIITANSTERKNTLDDDLIIRNPNKKQRPKIDEIANEKEKSNLGKALFNHQIMDLNGKPEMVNSNNKKIISKSTIKNKLINMPTNTNTNNNYKDDSLSKHDGIATPPDTPPRSPQMIPSISQKRPEDGITIKQLTLDKSQLATPPPSSSDSSEFNDDYISTQSTPTRPTRISQTSRKRRGSRSPQKSQSTLSTKRSIEMNAFQPPKKLQYPRSRRSSSVSSTAQESFTTQSSNKSKESQQSQPTVIKSRIPRLSTSSKERPVIAQKVSQGSLSSQGSNKFNDSTSHPVSSKLEPPRGLRLATSRPIINTSFISDVEAGSESPTGQSPINHSPTSYSSTSNTPSIHSVHQKKFISHDDVVIPTIAKKLKMKGQLHSKNHDALLGYEESEGPEDISPTTENGYMDITDQVVNLFDDPINKSHKKQSSISSVSSSQRRQRKNSTTGHSRNDSKTHYIAPRKQPQQTYEETPSPTNAQFENSFVHSAPHDNNNNIRHKRGRSRREEYIISVREDDDIEFIEPHTSMSLVQSEPLTTPTVQIESHDQIYQEKIVEPVPVQIPVVQEVEYNLKPVETVPAPIVTNSKKNKDKKKKKQKKNNGDMDDDDYVRKSRCRCAIQ